MAERRLTTHIALLRAINVGGRNRLPMKVLRSILEEYGARGVRIHLQSGNAVFNHGAFAEARFTTQVGTAIRQQCGFAPQILWLQPEELARAMQLNPFREARVSPATLHLGFLAATPERADLQGLKLLGKPSERFQLSDRLFYLHAPDGIGRSKLAARAENLLGVPMTLRNWRTVDALWRLTQELV